MSVNLDARIEKKKIKGGICAFVAITIYILSQFLKQILLNNADKINHMFIPNLLPVQFFHFSVLNETLHLLLSTHCFFQTHPGTNVTTIDMYDDMASLKPLWEQVDGFRKAVGPIMEEATDGIHLICFSQGLLHQLHFLTFLSCLVTTFALTVIIVEIT